MVIVKFKYRNRVYLIIMIMMMIVDLYFLEIVDFDFYVVIYYWNWIKKI